MTDLIMTQCLSNSRRDEIVGIRLFFVQLIAIIRLMCTAASFFRSIFNFFSELTAPFHSLIFYLVLCSALPRVWSYPVQGNFVDPQKDYALAEGRISDRDKQGKVYKVKMKNDNTRFLRAGDILEFRVAQIASARACRGTVRGVEPDYFSMAVVDLGLCNVEKKFLRRGTILRIDSAVLRERVYEASQYRDIMLEKRRDYLFQLKEINNFLWNFELEKIRISAEFDRKINKIEKDRAYALSDLLKQKREKSVLQKRLRRELYELDNSLKFYQVDVSEFDKDRFQKDLNRGLPVMKEPKKPKPREPSQTQSREMDKTESELSDLENEVD